MSAAFLNIIGAGGHAKVVLDAFALSMPGHAAVVSDDDVSVGCILEYEVIHPALCQAINARFFHVAIGSNQVRQRLCSEISNMGKPMLTICHPSASISQFAVLSEGCFVAAGSVVAAAASVGCAVIVNHGAIVDHDCEVGSWTHLAPNSVLGGAVRIGQSVFIGSGAVILPGVFVGDGATIGAGAVVTKNVPAGQTWVGIPARQIST